MRGRTQSESTGYPPRVILNLRQLNPTSSTILECRIDINGIREFPYVNLLVSPPLPAVSSLSRSHSEGMLIVWYGILYVNNINILRAICYHFTCLANTIIIVGTDDSGESSLSEYVLRKLNSVANYIIIYAECIHLRLPYVLCRNERSRGNN